MSLRAAVRLLPRPLRIELLRLRRLPAWIIETPTIARTRLSPSEQAAFPVLLACHHSPLERTPGAVPARLQQGKERNVTLAAQQIEGLLLHPNQIFSYHRTVGRPARWRGFRPGMELHEGKLSQGVGGGCCQVSNMLYLLALKGGMKVTERHRHGVDLFPDHGRTVPFGCGATVFYGYGFRFSVKSRLLYLEATGFTENRAHYLFYNYTDLRFENPLPQPVLLRFRIEARYLVGEMWAQEDPGWTAEIYEVEAQRVRDGNAWIRSNRIRRRFYRTDGTLLLDQEVAYNRGVVLYAMEEDSCSAQP